MGDEGKGRGGWPPATVGIVRRLFGRGEGPIAVIWVIVALASAGIVVLDFVSGPFVRFPIAFVLPVLVAARWSPRLAYALAVGAPALRLLSRATWDVPWPWSITAANAVIYALVLVAVARLMEKFVEQREELARLRVLTTICAYCKKVRTPTGSWEPIEAFVERSGPIDFSHTYCPDCVREHHPDCVDAIEPIEEPRVR